MSSTAIEKSSGAVIQLDWRADKDKTREQIFQKLAEIFIEIDQHGCCDIETSDSVAIGSVQLLRTDELGQPNAEGDRIMWVRLKNPFRRNVRNDNHVI
jgi:hypothetical protein